MRLHALHVTAFGPFADTVSLDFDALGDAGLFLLTGSTGAGKTSLLDAICFALFGQVPGDRQQAARWRSDAAAPGVVPRVELVLTIGARRLRFVRTPAWQRPKARGSGTTAQPATALVAELRDGAWETLATGIPDVSQLAVAALGMDVHQFTQVVMLPQGRFQEFLRSGAESRQAVLERLFATSHFREVERWLVSHRQLTGRQEEQHRRAVESLVDQIAAVAGAARPEVVTSSPPRWAATIAAELTTLCSMATAEAGALHGSLHSAQAARAETIRRAELRREGEAAQRVSASCAAQQEATNEAALRLQASERAHHVSALLAPLVTAEHERREVEVAVCLAHERAVAADVPMPSPELSPHAQLAALAELHREAQTRIDALRAASHEADTCRRLEQEIAVLKRQHAAAVAAQTRLEQRAGRLPDQLDELNAELVAARCAASGLEAVEVKLQTMRAVHAAATAAPPAAAVVDQLRARRDVATSRHNDAREALNDLRDRRLAGAAASLAGQLTKGEPCPVCGGCEHPSPATGRSDVPDEGAEVAAREAVAAAEIARAGAEAEHTRAQADLLLLTARADGHDAATAAATVKHLQGEQSAALAATELAGNLELRVADAAAEAAQLRRHLADASAQLAHQADHLAHNRGQLAVLHSRHPQLAQTDVSGEMARQVALCADLTELIVLLRALDATSTAEASARAHAKQAAELAGFPDIDAVREAALTAQQRASLQRLLQEHTAAVQGAVATLSDPDVQAALAGEPALVDAAEAVVLAAETDHARALRHAGELTSRAQQVDGLVTALTESVAAWAPVSRAHEVAESMASLAEGKSADNQLQMSLSAYVLSARLGQVVDAANERLGPMTSGRYALEHTVDRSAGERRRAGGGLGLRVCDAWTGHARDPKTLSGGEMFQASLALALGLADVVTHESGGMRLHSLFVDEGFGSLDADSLDEVMDVLDDLRSGGRVVGVVSHVEAMRERIPVQVAVVKGRAGSTVHQT